MLQSLNRLLICAICLAVAFGCGAHYERRVRPAAPVPAATPDAIELDAPPVEPVPRVVLI